MTGLLRHLCVCLAFLAIVAATTGVGVLVLRFMWRIRA